MTRRKIFAGNWKMYMGTSDADVLVKEILNGMSAVPAEHEVVIFPPFTTAKNAASLCKGSRISVGMQNMYYEDEGAFTGEISPLMVKDAGCRYVLLGHSERRHVFGENDSLINKKLISALEHKIEPMLCVGELLEERERGETGNVILRQLKGALAGLKKEETQSLVIAYEPVWAIGTGKVAEPETAEEVHLMIRGFVSDIFDASIAESMPILYGGSVKPDNIKGLYVQSNIDGVLVGGASLKADSFLNIAKVL